MEDASGFVALLIHSGRPPSLSTDQVGGLVQWPASLGADSVKVVALGLLAGGILGLLLRRGRLLVVRLDRVSGRGLARLLERIDGLVGGVDDSHFA
jgi:hypothetical protein